MSDKPKKRITGESVETPEQWCPVGCGAHEDPGPWHQRGCARWREVGPDGYLKQYAAELTKAHREGWDAAQEASARLHEQVRTHCDHEPAAGAGAMGSVIDYRDQIRALPYPGIAKKAQEGEAQ